MNRSERKAWLIKVIESIGRVMGSEDWKMVQREIFDERYAVLKRRQETEASREQIDTQALYRIQGQILESKNNSLAGLLETYRRELQGISGTETNQEERS